MLNESAAKGKDSSPGSSEYLWYLSGQPHSTWEPKKKDERQFIGDILADEKSDNSDYGEEELKQPEDQQPKPAANQEVYQELMKKQNTSQSSSSYPFQQHNPYLGVDQSVDKKMSGPLGSNLGQLIDILKNDVSRLHIIEIYKLINWIV